MVQGKEKKMSRPKKSDVEGKIISIWLKDVSLLPIWKRYAAVMGLSMADLYVNAITEYMTNNPPTDEMIHQYNQTLLDSLYH